MLHTLFQIVDEDRKSQDDEEKSSGECFPGSGCQFITKRFPIYTPSDPCTKCLLNTQQPSLERFLCLGKFYYESEKTDKIVYSYYDIDYYSYNSADSPNCAECLTVNRAVNMLAQFINALVEVVPRCYATPS